MRTYIARRRILSIALRGEGSVRMTKAMRIAGVPLTQRKKDAWGMLDQRTLMSMNEYKITNQMFSLIALGQSNLLRIRIQRAAMMRHVMNVRSNGLDSTLWPVRNQDPKGLPAINRIQMVGIQRARVTSNDCLRSSQSRRTTKAVHNNNASTGGNYIPLSDRSNFLLYLFLVLVQLD